MNAGFATLAFEQKYEIIIKSALAASFYPVPMQIPPTQDDTKRQVPFLNRIITTLTAKYRLYTLDSFSVVFNLEREDKGLIGDGLHLTKRAKERS